jgi:hypothetical protein
MSIMEFKSKIRLIIEFASKLNNEIIPTHIQKIIIKIYASTLNINLTDIMVENILEIANNNAACI